MERNPWLRTLIVLACAFLSVQLFLFAWHFLGYLHQTLTIFFLAWMLSFILNPAATALAQRWRFGRAAAVTAVYLAVLGAVALIGFLLVPPAVKQVATLGNKVPRESPAHSGVSA